MVARDYSGFQAVVNSVEKLRETVNIEADKQLSVFRVIRDTQNSQLRILERMVESLRSRSQTRNNFGFPDRLEFKNVRLETRFVSLSARSVIVETKGGLSREKQSKTDSQQLAKALGSEIKKIKVGGGLGNPLQIFGAGILFQFGAQFAKGIEKSLNKQFDFSFKGVGRVAGTAITDPKQAAKDAFKMRRDSVLRRRSVAMVKDIKFQKGTEIDKEYQRYDEELETIRQQTRDTVQSKQAQREAEENHKNKLAEINKKYAEFETNIEGSTKPIVFAVGGFGGTGGKGGIQVKRELEKTLGRKTAHIEIVDNPESDYDYSKVVESIPDFIKKNPQFAEDIEKLKKRNFNFDRVDKEDGGVSYFTEEIVSYFSQKAQAENRLKDFTKGYNPDAVKLAAKIADARRKNPNAPIDVVGYSGGGFAVEEALAILKEMGITDIQGTGAGTPNLGIGYKKNRNFKRVMGTTDRTGEYYKFIEEDQATALNFRGFSDTTEHQFPEYLANPATIKSLSKPLGAKALKGVVDPRILKLVKLQEDLKGASTFEGDKAAVFVKFIKEITEINKYIDEFVEELPDDVASIKEELKKLLEKFKDSADGSKKKAEKDTKPDDQSDQVSTKQDIVETPDKVQQETKPNEFDQVPTRTDTPARPDGGENQSPDRNPDIVPVGPVELPPSAGNNLDIEADATRGGGITSLARQFDTYQQTLRESLARVLDAEKAQTEIEIEPGFWVDVEQLNQGFVKRTQTQLILFWEKLRANLGTEIKRTITGLLGTIPGATIGRGITGDPLGGYLGGIAGRLVAETGFQDVSNFRSLQQQGMSPVTAKFWQQFGNNRKFLPNTLRKTAVGYVTGSVVGRGINDVMQATGANQLIGALMPSWLETAIADGINRTIKTIADPNIDLAIPNLPPAANKILSAPLHAVGKSVAAQGFLGNVATSFLDNQTKTALMPVREALTGAGQVLGGEGLLGEYLGDRFTGLGIGAIQDTAKASGRGVAGMIAPGLPAEVRNFIADQVIKQGVLDGTVRGQVAPFLAERAGSDLFARGVKIPITGKVAGTINKTLDRYDPYAIAPKKLTDEQILLEREKRFDKKRKNAINAVENLFNRIDKSVDETTKAVVGIGNGFLGFFDNIRTKTYDFAKKTAGLTDNPVTLIDQYIVYLDQLVQDAQKQAQETVKGIIPDYKNLTIPERKKAIGSYKEKVATEVKKFRMAIEDGESQIALEIGENILALVESTRKVYKDLLEAVPSDLSGTKSIEANQRYLTSVQTEVLKGQPNLKGRAKTGLMQLVGTETSEGFIKGIEERLNKVRNSGKELAESAIEGAKKRLGIASPSKEFEKLGKNSGEGFEIGAVESLKDAGKAILAEIEKIKAEVVKELKGIVKPSKLDKFLAGTPSKTLTTKGLDGVIYRLANSFNLKPEHQKIIDKLALYGRTQKPSIIRMHGSDLKHKIGDSVEFSGATSFTGKVDEVKKTGSLGYLKLQPGGSLYEVVNPKRGFDIPYDDSPYADRFVDEDETITSGKYRVVGKKQKTISVDYGEKDGIEKLKVTIYQLEEIRSEIDKSISLLSKPVAQLKSAFDKLGKDTIEGFVQRVQGDKSDAIDVIAELVDSVIEKAKDDLEIQSPSRIFEEIGQRVVEGFNLGVQAIQTVISTPIDQALTAVDNNFSVFIDNAQQGFNNFIAQIEQQFPIFAELKDLILGIAAGFVLNNIFELLVGQITALGDASFGAVLELESIRLALTSVTGSAEAGAKGLAFVREEAQRLGIELKTAEEAYTGFLAVTRYTVLEGEQANRIFSVFQETAARRGLSNEEQGRMFAAINQAMSKRKLSAEEVRGQLGEIPGLAFESTVARSLGVNPAQLSEMMSDGLLMAEDIFPKVAALYQAENTAIVGGTETTVQALTRFQNAIVNLQRSFEGWIAPAKTFFNFFAAAIEKISEIIPIVVRYLGIFSAALFIDFAKISINLIKFLSSLKTVQVVLQGLAKVAVAAFKFIYKELLIFLKQFALLTLAVDAVSAAFYILSNNAFPELKKGVEETTEETNRLIEALRNLGKETKNIPRDLPKTEEEIVTKRNWNIFGFDTGFNLEGTRQFLNNIDKTLGFEPALTTVGQQELSNFQENAAGILSNVNKTLTEQFNVEKVIKEIRELDKELTQSRSRQFNIPAGDKKRYEAAIKEQQKLIEERDKKLSVTASFETALQNQKTEIEKQLKELDGLVARKGITEDAEKALRTQLEQGLKDIDKTSTAFDDLMSNLQKSVNALTLALRNLNEQAAYFNETLQRNATNARVQFIRRARAAGVGSQVRELGLEEIDQNTLESRIIFLRDQLGAVNELLTKPDFADVLTELRQQAEDMGVNLENTATIDRLINENRSQQETAVLNALKEQLRLQDELGQAEENLEQSISSTRSAITDLNRSVEDYFFNLNQQIEEALVETDRILNKLKSTDIRNKLQRALVPGSDTFVNGLIGQIQGIFDRASGIFEQVLGQRSARINFAGERRGLQYELENFTRNLGGATEALELFRQGLLGGQPSGVGSQPSASGRFAIGTVGATGIGTGAHLDIRGKDRQGNRLPESRLRELLSLVFVGGKPLSEQLDKITSGYGHRRPPTRGASSFHPALDFGFSPGTPIEFTGQAVSARTFFDKGGGGNVVEIILPNGEKLQLLHLDSVANLGTIQRGRVNTPGNTQRRGMPNVPFASLIEGAAKQYGLDPLLFAALIKKESGFRQEKSPGQILTSSAGAVGIAQLKRSTARELGVNPDKVAENLIGGAKYLARMLERFGGNIELALSAYKAGPGNVRNNQMARGTVQDVGIVMQYYREFQQASRVVTANQPAVPNPPIPNVNNAAAEELTNRLIQIKENQVNLGDASLRQDIEAFLIELQQTKDTILRQMGDSIRENIEAVTNAQNSLQDIRQRYSPQTQSAQLETELRGVENEFRGLDNQLFEQERGLTDNIQGLDLLLNQMKEVLVILTQSDDQLSKESASFLMGLIGRIEQDKATYSGMRTEIQQLRGQLKEGKLDAENFVKAQAKLRTIQADLERISTELSIAQEQNNLEQERAIALLQSRQQLELDLLQIAQDFEGEDRDKRLTLAREQARLREREIEYQFQSKTLSQETELISQRLAIAQNLSNLGKINELELLQSQKQLEQEILEIKKQYPDLADQELRINLAKEQARLREIGIENNYNNQRWQRQQELFDMESRITEARATRLERSGQPFEAAAMREELAFRAELLRYEQEIEAIRQRYTDPADEQTKNELIRNAGILLGLNLEQIDQQFKDLGETIRDTASGAFATFLEDTLTGTKSIGDAFLDMAQSILKSLAQIAARMAIGGLFRLLKLPIPGFADGGTVPNFAEGDTVKSAKNANLPFKGIQEALKKEGPRGVLAVFTPGEEILSLRTGEAQRYQRLKTQLGKNPLAKIGNFADGGTIGINESLLAGLNYGMPTADRLPNNFGQTTQISNYGGDRSVTVNVTAPNPSAFNASERQIGRTIAEYLSRV
jgi:tape measure domain-containing protein